MADAKRDANYVTTLLGVSSSDSTTPVVVWADVTTHRLLVDALVSSAELAGHDAVGDGIVTLSTAGTRQQLSAQACSRVVIEANAANDGVIVVGGSSVVAAESTRRGISLYATQSKEFFVSNMNLLYIDGTVNGNKINFYYEA